MSDVKIGIYGGTFDPVHLGHIRSVYAFLTACDLDRLFIMPNYLPPHKSLCPGDDPMMRLQMLKIAFGPLPFYNDKVIVSDFEIRNREVSYTYKTLEHFKWISNDITLLYGTDNFLNLEYWRNAERIFELAKIAHIVRPGTYDESDEILQMKDRYRDKYGATIIDVPMAPIELSSTEIREKIKRGENTSYLMPQSVRDFIDQYDLYGEHNA
ncbi:MAG: nicotinate (nicotinamide) nucleotide adenylyltransferase [Ruminococcaceae bacterium]|nr:nicotinate (nicotinamide) nucleotide adenylyltransferase [Oscillospiraceae bacterium]